MTRPPPRRIKDTYPDGTPDERGTEMETRQEYREQAIDAFDEWCRDNGQHVIDNDGVVVEVAEWAADERRHEGRVS